MKTKKIWAFCLNPISDIWIIGEVGQEKNQFLTLYRPLLLTILIREKPDLVLKPISLPKITHNQSLTEEFFLNPLQCFGFLEPSPEIIDFYEKKTKEIYSKIIVTKEITA